MPNSLAATYAPYDSRGRALDVVSDEDPEYLEPGDELAGPGSSLIRSALVAKVHPITASKIMLNAAKLARSARSLRGTPEIIMPAVPWLKLDAEDWALHPELKGVEFVSMNGNNREHLYSHFGLPANAKIHTRDMVDPVDWHLSLEAAARNLEIEPPITTDIHDASKMTSDEIHRGGREFAARVKGAWGKVEPDQFPAMVRETIGSRPFVKVPNNAGWMAEMYSPSGNDGSRFQPFSNAQKEVVASGIDPIAAARMSQRDLIAWTIENSINPLNQWSALAAHKLNLYGDPVLGNLANSNPHGRIWTPHIGLINPFANETRNSMPHILNEQFQKELPAQDVPFDPYHFAIRKFPGDH